MLPELGRCDVLLEIANKERPRGFGMILVDFGLVRPKLVVLDVVSLIRRDLDLAAEKELVMGDFECFFDVLGFLEADQSVSVACRTDDLHPCDLAVLFVLVEEAVLEGGIAAASGQITYADRQWSTILRNGGVSGTMRRATR